MKKIIGALAFTSVFFFACSTQKNTASSGSATTAKSATMHDRETFQLTGISTDSTYGYSSKNPINVGGKDALSGPTRERYYLNALTGPEKEMVVYNRKGSCCGIKSDNALMGVAILDIYEIKYDGLEKPVILYLNMYDPGDMKAPVGFNYKK